VPRIVEWFLEEFVCCDIRTQLIDFSIDDHDFVMIFTHLSEFNDDDSIAQLSEKAGFDVSHSNLPKLTNACKLIDNENQSSLAQVLKDRVQPSLIYLTGN
jgi:hypothetical protein